MDGGVQCSVNGPDLFDPIVLYPICCNPFPLETLCDSINFVMMTSKRIFLSFFCLDHSKLEVVLQNC